MEKKQNALGGNANVPEEKHASGNAAYKEEKHGSTNATCDENADNDDFTALAYSPIEEEFEATVTDNIPSRLKERMNFDKTHSLVDAQEQSMGGDQNCQENPVVNAHEQHTVGATSFQETKNQNFTSGGSNAQEQTTTGSSGRGRSNYETRLQPPQENEEKEREFALPPPRKLDAKKERHRSKSRSRSPRRRRDYSSDNDNTVRRIRRDSVFTGGRVGVEYHHV